MPIRSSRLVYAFWDDRDETYWHHIRRDARQREHMAAECPTLAWETISCFRRTLYTYRRTARAKGFVLDAARANNLFPRTTSKYRPGAAAGEYAMMRRAMAVLITCWEPYVCGVRTKALDALARDPGPFRAAWMLYVHPSLAGTIVAPDVPVVEPAPDGGLILAATTRTLDAAMPDHVEATRRIAAAVAHLNVARPTRVADPADPWPPCDGYHSINYYEPRDRLWLGKTLSRIDPDQQLYLDATNRHVVGRIGPPDGTWEADRDRDE